MLCEFPAELILETLSYLSVQSLCSLQVTCKDWNKFIFANESLIYHKAAVLHRFISSLSVDLPVAKSAYAERFVIDVQDWKSFCRRRFQLEKNWLGRGPSAVRTVSAAGERVHRIKVDEELGIVITTHATGGLVVTDFNSDCMLWSLDRHHVRPYAHCEYSNGFLVFDRLGGYKEVWRIVGCHLGQPATEFLPDEWQVRAAVQSSVHNFSLNRRGHFEPRALLRMPSTTRAFRFVFPTLLVVGPHDAYLWDIPSATLIQTVQISLEAGEELSYVELSERHIFICSSYCLSIFSRSNGALVLKIGRAQFSDAASRMQLRVDEPSPEYRVPGASVVLLEHVYRYARLNREELVAVHVSADGRDLVLLGDEEDVFFVRDFERVIRGEATFASVTVVLSIEAPHLHAVYHLRAVYHAFENAKVALAMCSGIYVITLDPEYHGIASAVRSTSDGAPLDAYPFPNISVCRVIGFDDSTVLEQISCLQMTKTGVFFTWNSARLPRLDHGPALLGDALTDIFDTEAVEDGVGSTDDDSDADAGNDDLELLVGDITDHGSDDDADNDDVYDHIHADPEPYRPSVTFVDFALEPGQENRIAFG